MHHLEIFGRLSLQLGANPRLWTYVMNRTVYWTPSYNKYSMDLSTLLLNNTTYRSPKYLSVAIILLALYSY